MFTTPVLILIFNRPEKTKQLIRALEKVKPKYLYISADGPRPARPDEIALCEEARKAAQQVSWNCEIKTRFLEQNAGCKQAVSSGISWFFEQEQEGIILEDDCIPTPSFFSFAERMLSVFRTDSRVLQINGSMFLGESSLQSLSEGAYLSRIPHVWGWATWRRAWSLYDGDMSDLGRVIQAHHLRSLFSRRAHARFWERLFIHVKEKQIDSWAIPWAYSVMSQRGLCVAPRANLVQNIGFDAEATHTSQARQSITPTTKELVLEEQAVLHAPLRSDLDAVVMEHVFMRSLLQRVRDKLRAWYTAATT